MGRIDGKVVVVTGAASGIGAATAARFAVAEFEGGQVTALYESEFSKTYE